MLGTQRALSKWELLMLPALPSAFPGVPHEGVQNCGDEAGHHLAHQALSTTSWVTLPPTL